MMALAVRGLACLSLFQATAHNVIYLTIYPVSLRAGRIYAVPVGEKKMKKHYRPIYDYKTICGRVDLTLHTTPCMDLRQVTCKFCKKAIKRYRKLNKYRRW
jgi:hypothetical protein